MKTFQALILVSAALLSAPTAASATDPANREVFTKEDREYAIRISDYWFEFARTGRPAAGNAEWPNDDRGHDRTMNFGPTIRAQNNFMKARLNIFIRTMKILGDIESR